MADVTVTLDEAAIQDLLTGPNGPVVQYVWRTVVDATNLAKQECPHDTGLLMRSHQYTVDVQNTDVVGKFGATAEYAADVHYGTQPHDIVPKNRQALAFKIGGKTIIVHRVHHPGTKPNPWLIRTAQKLGLQAEPV